jgi:hypothetical protein
VQTSPVKKLRKDSVASAGLVQPTSSSPPSETTHKRNLMGNWAMGCRKMYGMGTPDDLGIWFVFNVSSSRYAPLSLLTYAWILGHLDPTTGKVCAPVQVLQPQRHSTRCASRDSAAVRCDESCDAADKAGARGQDGR